MCIYIYLIQKNKILINLKLHLHRSINEMSAVVLLNNVLGTFFNRAL